MAGDWIKMRSDLFTHPKVVRMSSALKADTLRTVGGLMSVWCLFDAHSEDGKLIGYTAEILDDHLRWPGFASAMQAISWLSYDGESLVLPEFETHNGQSAKRRAQDADRKRDVRKTSASDADKKRTREEKRREEKEEEHSSSGDDAKVQSMEARLSEVTTDAVETWNESALVAGGLAKVRTSVGMDKRRKQVRRMLSVAREICRERFGETRIPRKFWVGLWDQYAGDDFFAGRTTGGKGHENWRPDFKYLTHPETVVKLYDKVCAGEATA